MRVALIDPAEFSPPYDAALARGLAAAGHEVRLYGMAGGPLAEEAELDHEGHFYRPLASRLGKPLEGGAARALKGLLHGPDMLRLVSRLARFAPDVIHCQWLPLPAIDGLFGRSLRGIAPVVLTLHDTVPFNGAEPWLMRAGLGRLLEAADGVITHTEQGRKRLAARGLAAERLHVVPHGLLGPRIDGIRPKRRRLTLLQLGRIKPYKGVDLLIEAVAGLDAEERAGLEVRICGKPHIDMAPLEARIAALGLDDCITLRLGFLDDAAMQGELGRADALLFPYREIEASGVLMVAVARGMPVIASRIGVFAEMLEDGGEGLLTPPGDKPALTRALRHLLEEPDRLGRMRAAMRHLRDRIPDWSEIGRRTAEVYAKAARRREAAFSHDPAPSMESGT